MIKKESASKTKRLPLFFMTNVAIFLCSVVYSLLHGALMLDTSIEGFYPRFEEGWWLPLALCFPALLSFLAEFCELGLKKGKESLMGLSLLITIVSIGVAIFKLFGGLGAYGPLAYLSLLPVAALAFFLAYLFLAELSGKGRGFHPLVGTLPFFLSALFLSLFGMNGFDEAAFSKSMLDFIFMGLTAGVSFVGAGASLVLAFCDKNQENTAKAVQYIAYLSLGIALISLVLVLVFRLAGWRTAYGTLIYALGGSLAPLLILVAATGIASYTLARMR